MTGDQTVAVGPPVRSRNQRGVNLKLETVQVESKSETPRTMEIRTLVEAIRTAMSRGLERLLAAKDAKKPTKNSGLPTDG